MSDFHNRSQTSARRSDYVWQYEYYDDEEPVSFEGLKAHRCELNAPVLQSVSPSPIAFTAFHFVHRARAFVHAMSACQQTGLLTFKTDNHYRSLLIIIHYSQRISLLALSLWLQLTGDTRHTCLSASQLSDSGNLCSTCVIHSNSNEQAT